MLAHPQVGDAPGQLGEVADVDRRVKVEAGRTLPEDGELPHAVVVLAAVVRVREEDGLPVGALGALHRGAVLDVGGNGEACEGQDGKDEGAGVSSHRELMLAMKSLAGPLCGSYQF